jgi:hypothetical protein
MGSSDPAFRMRRLATLRAAYDTALALPGHHASGGTTRHSKALLGRILIVLGGMPDDAAAAAVTPGGKASRGA